MVALRETQRDTGRDVGDTLMISDDNLDVFFTESEDDILYYTNWKILSVLCLITGMVGLGFAFVVFFFTGGEVPFVVSLRSSLR